MRSRDFSDNTERIKKMNRIRLLKEKLQISIAISLAMLILLCTACSNAGNRADIGTKDEAVSQDSDGLKFNGENATGADISKSDTGAESLDPANPTDGSYELDITLSGGSGKSSIKSPARAEVTNGKIEVTLEWSSSNYDYMIVEGQKYLPLNEEGNSTFRIPISSLQGSLDIVADTVAMSSPHEIQYQIIFDIYGTEKNTDGEVDINQKNENQAAFDNWLKSHAEYKQTSLKYAKEYRLYESQNNGSIIEIAARDYYIVIQSDEKLPSDLPDFVTPIEAPVSRVCLVSSASIDYFSSLGAMETVGFTSIRPEDTLDEELRSLMQSGEIQYTGKYSAPDYERLLAGGCRLLVENTMILHSENVLDQLHKLGMDTMIDYSSKESSPLGRMEWIKLYGLLTGRAEKASEIFAEREGAQLADYRDTGLSVAYFYVTDNGAVVVRKNQDYIANLLETAGGRYLLDGDSRYDGTGTMTIQKEAFFEKAFDCDYLIYNSTISGGVKDSAELVKKCEVIKNTKAYKEGHIYCTRDNIYQSVMELPEITADISRMLNGQEPEKYLYKL